MLAQFVLETRTATKALQHKSSQRTLDKEKQQEGKAVIRTFLVGKSLEACKVRFVPCSTPMFAFAIAMACLIQYIVLENYKELT